MASQSQKYLQIIAYAMIIAIFVFAISITRNCGRLPFVPKEGFSEGDTLDIALVYGPGSFYMYGDSLAGINQEIALNFSHQTGVPVKLWPLNEAASGFEKLEAGAFDILASLPLDNYIKNRFPVSESVFLDRLVLIQLADSAGNKAVNSSLDLNGRSVFVAPGSSAINRLSNLSEEIGGKIEIIEADGLSDELLCLQVASAEIPLAVVNERIAKALAKNYPLLNYDTSVSFTQFQVWVFNPSDSIVAINFNEWFDSFRISDSYRKIIDKY
ncbi:MAG: transporter substrate-binding domain-containing protein [Muribaculaceae bacterium]|nr:transporter substrate-binding domain-containing protein [Muribaculaceae bacterium]